MNIRFVKTENKLNPEVGSILVAKPNHRAGRGHRHMYYLIIEDSVNRRVTLLNLSSNNLMSNTSATTPYELLEIARMTWQYYDFNEIISQEEYELVRK